MKLLLTSLFLLASLATLLQLRPALTTASSSAPPALASTPQAVFKFKRSFHPVGSAAYLFIHMGAYRAGPDTFAVVGLASKPLHVFANPRFRCQWLPPARSRNRNHTASSLSAPASKILPDWGYGRVYTVLVLNCTFQTPVGLNASGGKLLLHASANGGGDADVDSVETLVALEEQPGSVDVSVFSAPPHYDYLYCGSPLYGNLSPQRIRSS